MKLKGRSVDQWGNVVFDSEGLIDHLMRGQDITPEMAARPTSGVVKFNQLCRELDHPEDQLREYSEPEVSVASWDEEHQREWFTPEPWASMDVLEWLLDRCQSTTEIERVLAEWILFQERDMVDVLRCLIYLIHSFRENGTLWGVGRGSSVASYCLYLIGVHRVDSIRYDLDIREFLK